MSLLEIVIALIIVSVMASFLSYIMGFFSIIPSSIMAILILALALDIVLFVIHRK